jgi:hypothetical protein
MCSKTSKLIYETYLKGEQCIVKKLSESYELSPFFVVNVNGQEHIISGLGYLLLPIANTTVILFLLLIEAFYLITMI